MKNFYKLFPLLLVAILILSACSPSRESMHNRGVNNSGFKGY
jgi:hypothetical protein